MATATFCGKCGAPRGEGRFCGKCGAPLPETATPSAPQTEISSTPLAGTRPQSSESETAILPSVAPNSSLDTEASGWPVPAAASPLVPTAATAVTQPQIGIQIPDSKRKTPFSNRRVLLATLVGFLLVAALAGGLAYFAGVFNSKESAGPAATNPPTKPAGATSPTSPTAVTSPATTAASLPPRDTSGYVSKVDELLFSSAQTLANVKTFAPQVAHHSIGLSEARSEAQGFVQARQRLVLKAEALTVPSSFSASQLLLLRSLRISLADDQALLAWIDAKASGGSGRAQLNRVNAIGARATELKANFLRTYATLRKRETGLLPGSLPKNY